MKNNDRDVIITSKNDYLVYCEDCYFRFSPYDDMAINH